MPVDASSQVMFCAILFGRKLPIKMLISMVTIGEIVSNQAGILTLLLSLE
jgi:hypothetical protein